MTSDREPKRVSRLDVVKSFAHPLRLRLYYALASRGSANATQLARDVDTTAQLAFYHLSKLAELGVVEDDDERTAVGRERLWRQATAGLSFDAADFPDDAAGEMLALHRTQAQVHAHLLDVFFTQAAKDPHGPFNQAAFGTDMILNLTPQEMRELNETVTELLTELRSRRSAAQGTASGVAAEADTRAIVVTVHGFPVLP